MGDEGSSFTKQFRKAFSLRDITSLKSSLEPRDWRDFRMAQQGMKIAAPSQVRHWQDVARKSKHRPKS